MLFSAAEEYTMSRENPTPPPARRWADPDRFPGYLTVGVALLVWRLFFPALMSADSISQYGQALSGQLNDWHPPLMASVLKVVLGLGGGLGLLMLGQCLAGALGVRALATACLGLLYGERLAPRRAAWISLLVLLVCLLPVTPLAFYLMTFWKDAWAMVFLLWMAALLIDLFLGGPRRGRLLLLLACATGFGLVRHNALVVLPLVGLALWIGLRRSGGGRGAALALAAAPLALYLAVTPVIDTAFQVRTFHPDSQIMAIDLVGICAADRGACARLPWTRAHIRDEGGLARYRPGDVGFIFWDVPSPVDPAIRLDYPRLRGEYLRAVREFPGVLLGVKLRAFATLLGLDRTFYFFHGSIVANPYGLKQTGHLAPLRQLLIATAGGVAADPVLRWVSGVHLVWIAVDLLWVTGLLAASWGAPEERRAGYRFLACVTLIPLAYYASYLLATPMHDFRFMYPSTLMAQCVTLSWGLGWALGGLAQKPTGRAPNLARFSA
jgi:hypothetical protein